MKIRERKMPARRVLKRFRGILSRLIDFWSPRAIAVEDIVYVQAKKSVLLNTLAEEIKKIGKEKRVKVYFHPPLSARKFICRKEKPTKMNVAKILSASYYPWLRKNYEKEKRKPWWKAKYDLRIFDAIAVGLFCLRQRKRNSA
ncbi:MAG: hypothetical protein ABII89_02300 [Candidatus Omnitrophota bacterium]